LANTILTPVTLWKDFDDTLPLSAEVLSERTEEGVICRELYMLGRQAKCGRVKIYAWEYVPAGMETYPAVLVMFEAGFSVDKKFVKHLTDHGYGVLCVDYCGDMENGQRHTIYPRDIDYANYLRAGRAREYVDDTAKETSWYEWAGVARYAAQYLQRKPEVTRFGAIGLRTGGEVLWKITPYSPLSCFVSVCAAGWLAYRHMEKFTDNDQVFDAERHCFIAGLDSQSYAPHAKCPVLILSAVNDKKSNYDRVYDTFQQINPEVEKAFLYSSHGNGLMGAHSFSNIDLFLDKTIKGRSVYISKPVVTAVFVDEDNCLKIRIRFDGAGDPQECGVFFAEKVTTYKARDWTRIVGNFKSSTEETVEFPMDSYIGSQRMLYYAFVRYSNGFSVTSKIQEIQLKQPYRNSFPKSRILYSSEGGVAGISVYRNRANAIADCFIEHTDADVKLCTGYGGIVGASCKRGIVCYRVGDPGFEPPHGAVFAFEAYAFRDTTLNVIFYVDAEEKKGFSCTLRVTGGGKWKRFVCESSEFKSETGVSLSEFGSTVSVVFLGEDDVLVNHVIWL